MNLFGFEIFRKKKESPETDAEYCDRLTARLEQAVARDQSWQDVEPLYVKTENGHKYMAVGIKDRRAMLMFATMPTYTIVFDKTVLPQLIDIFQDIADLEHFDALLKADEHTDA